MAEEQDRLPSYVPPPGNRPRGGRGRPANSETFKAIIEKEMGKLYRKPSDEADAEDSHPTQITYKEKMVQAAIRQAANGNLNALIELMNRTEGKVADKVQQDITHTYRVVPWDDEDAPGMEYVENDNLSDRPDAGRLLPPPDATDQNPPEFYRKGRIKQDDVDLYPHLSQSNGQAPAEEDAGKP
jgi:hypothetical protein